MAKVIKTPAFVVRVRNRLRDELARVGVNADVAFERVGKTRLYRFTIVAGNFAKLTHTERQRLVWRIVDQELDPNQQLLISMILTLTPSEFGQAA